MDNQAALIRLVDTGSFAGIAAMAGPEKGRLENVRSRA
jgi:hypothetical protein